MAALLLALLAAALPPGCAKPTPQPTAPNPEAELLAGHWEQFIPVASLPQSVTLDASGSAAVDGADATWRIEGDTLYLRRGRSEDAYAYTVSGYMLTLTDANADASDFYINPEAFAAGADRNAQLAGQWAAFSTFESLRFNGAGGLSDVVYTTAGRTELPMKYAARDGILQTADASGNMTYNLYDFSPEGALLLAETSDYDNPNRRWTAYWKKTDPDAGLLGEWKLAFHTQGGNAGLPAALTLGGGGAGSMAAQGAAPVPMLWEYYDGGFAVLDSGGADLQYFWCEQADGVLSLGNPDVDEAWYFDESRYRPEASGLKAIEGAWREEDAEMGLDVGPGGVATAVDDEGRKTGLAAAAAGGLMKLTTGGKTYYIAYGVDGDEMKLYYGDVPFFGAKEMPVTLVKR